MISVQSLLLTAESTHNFQLSTPIIKLFEFRDSKLKFYNK